MDSGKLLELAIIAVILMGIGFVIWRGGAANPVSTGTVQHKVNNFGHEMKALGAKLSGFGDQISQLQKAAETGAFDPLMVWHRAK